MKASKVVEVQLHTLLTIALYRGEWSPSMSSHFTPMEKFPSPPTPSIPFNCRLAGRYRWLGCLKEEKSVVPVMVIKSRFLRC